MYYQVQGTVVETKLGHSVTHQIPTFYLNEDVQGIVDCEHAEKIAKGIVNPTNDENLAAHLYVTTVFEGA